MLKYIYIFSTAFIFIAVGCGGKKVRFGTYTEMNVAGVEATSTGDISLKIGYDRGEIAHIPDNGEAGYSILGTFDSDIQIFSGYYINEKFATGNAAVIAAQKIAAKGNQNLPGDLNPRDASQPLIYTTGTRFGFHTRFSLNGAAPNPIEVLLGYKRANYVVIPINEDTKEVRSTYADIVIGEGNLRKKVEKEPEQNNNGLIIKQKIATGRAAQILVQKPEISKSLIEIDEK